MRCDAAGMDESRTGCDAMQQGWLGPMGWDRMRFSRDGWEWNSITWDAIQQGWMGMEWHNMGCDAAGVTGSRMGKDAMLQGWLEME